MCFLPRVLQELIALSASPKVVDITGSAGVCVCVCVLYVRVRVCACVCACMCALDVAYNLKCFTTHTNIIMTVIDV